MTPLMIIVGMFLAVAPTRAPIQPRTAPLIKNHRRPKMSASLPLTVTITAATKFHLRQGQFQFADSFVEDNSRNSNPDIVFVWSYVGVNESQDCGWHDERE